MGAIKLINRAKSWKVTHSTKVSSNHFGTGYRSKECPNPTLYMKGYNLEAETKRKRPPLSQNRTDHHQPTVQGTRKRKLSIPELPELDTASGKRKEVLSHGE